MKDLLVAVVVFWLSPAYAASSGDIAVILGVYGVGIWVAYLILRAIWRAISSGEVARKAGNIAAHGSKQIDTFKSAYRDGKDK